MLQNSTSLLKDSSLLPHLPPDICSNPRSNRIVWSCILKMLKTLCTPTAVAGHISRCRSAVEQQSATKLFVICTVWGQLGLYINYHFSKTPKYSKMRCSWFSTRLSQVRFGEHGLLCRSAQYLRDCMYISRFQYGLWRTHLKLRGPLAPLGCAPTHLIAVSAVLSLPDVSISAGHCGDIFPFRPSNRVPGARIEHNICSSLAKKISAVIQ